MTRLAWLALLLAAPAFAAIGVIDDTGVRVEVAKPAARIVALAPNTA